MFVGCAQGLALVPGLSRAGLTISAARSVGLSRSDALDFSFLMATPIIAGAAVLTLLDIFSGSVDFPAIPITIVGFVSSVIASVLAILFLRKMVISHSLSWFSLYLVPLGVWLLLA